MDVGGFLCWRRRTSNGTSRLRRFAREDGNQFLLDSAVADFCDCVSLNRVCLYWESPLSAPSSVGGAKRLLVDGAEIVADADLMLCESTNGQSFAISIQSSGRCAVWRCKEFDLHGDHVKVMDFERAVTAVEDSLDQLHAHVMMAVDRLRQLSLVDLYVSEGEFWTSHRETVHQWALRAMDAKYHSLAATVVEAFDRLVLAMSLPSTGREKKTDSLAFRTRSRCVDLLGDHRTCWDELMASIRSVGMEEYASIKDPVRGFLLWQQHQSALLLHRLMSQTLPALETTCMSSIRQLVQLLRNRRDQLMALQRSDNVCLVSEFEVAGNPSLVAVKMFGSPGLQSMLVMAQTALDLGRVLLSDGTVLDFNGSVVGRISPGNSMQFLDADHVAVWTSQAADGSVGVIRRIRDDVVVGELPRHATQINCERRLLLSECANCPCIIYSY